MDEGNIAMAIVNSPINLFGVSLCALLLAASLYVLRSWLRSSKLEQNEEKRKLLPRMKKRDFYVGDLTPFNGIDNERILIGVNFKVFDVTNRGRDFYGPGWSKFVILQYLLQMSCLACFLKFPV